MSNRNGSITVKIKPDSHLSIQDIQKYSNKSKNVLSGKSTSPKKDTSIMKITKGSIIAKKALHR